MGVTGLWRLIEPSGKPVPLETLENKILAIDVSIWLHQAIKGFQDSQGAPLPNAHLLGIYHRVCKLLYFRIKPIFVFDGGVPHLKKETIIKRQQQRSKKLSEAEQIQRQLLTTLLKHAAVKNVLSEKTKAALTSPKTSPTKAKESDNLYKLPPTDFTSSITSSDEETSESDYSPSKTWDLHTINEKSEHFKSLPADVRHDILTELKETRKQSSWGKIHEMPKKSDDFSGFQMKRLLKRYSVQACLEEAAKEMGGHSLSLSELEALLNDQGVVTSSSGSRIASDENARYLLIKDVKKAMEDAKKQEASETIDKSDYQKNLEAAVQLSLQDMPGPSKNEPEANYVENFCDGDFQSSSDNSELEETAPVNKNLGTAKNYMVEYSGLTPTEINKIIGKNKVSRKKKSSPVALVNYKATGAFDTDEVKSTSDVVNVSDSSDDDFLEVSENLLNIDTEKKEKGLEVVIQPDENIQDEDDLFSDIFNSIKNTAIENPIERENAQKTSKDVLIGNQFPQLQQNIKAVVISDKTSKEVIEVNKNSKNFTKDSNLDAQNADFPIITRLESNNGASNVESKNTENNDTLTKEQVQRKNVDSFSIVELEETSRGKTKNTHDKPIQPNLDVESDSLTEILVNKQDNIDKITSESATVNNLNKESQSTLPDEITPRQNHLTVEDLQEMAADLGNEKRDLESGRLAKERLANNLTDQIYQEAQELLQLFGVPYIIAPMEAEAQCAFLNSINITDGIITDDSDVWLFGGKTVYKNFFNQRKHVLEYRLESIQQHFKLTREQMVLLALLVGSDYTTGLQGVGPVTALEIIAKFPPNDELISGLSTFRKWLSSDNTGRNLTLRKKLKNVMFTEGFPSLQVVKAYLEPAVDTSEEAFSWAKPDINGLLEFARQKFGWNRVKSEEILKPVLKRLSENITQRSIKDFFQTKHKTDGGDAEAKMSKRVKKAVEAIGKGGTDDLEENVEAKPRAKRKRFSVIDEDLKVLEKTLVRSKKKVKEINTKIKEEIKKPKVAPDMHKKEVIPQKEQDKVDALRSKLKAIEVLRKSQKGPGFVKKRKQVVRKLKVDAELSESSSD